MILSGCINNDGQTQGPEKLQMTPDWDKVLSWVFNQHLVVSKEQSEDILKISGEDYFQILFKIN